MMKKTTFLERLNSELQEGWEAKLRDDGRIYYINHKTQTSSWLPPRENWLENANLPYGWETALDSSEKPYFINHVDKYTTRDDPRLDPDYVEPPRPREVELIRDQDKGFGFVAGSEKPVVVRFVTEGGPSVDKLLPGDLILKINGEEVRRAPREKVIELVRSCKHSILLTVCQPYSDNSSRKSAILTAAKKAKLKNNPSRVRFADAIMINGASVASSLQSPQESYMPFMPNVLKVFLENGQTKSFKYDNKTTVKDVVHSLEEKLNITCTHHFSLVLQNMKSNVPGKMTFLQDHETLAELAARPGARHFRCLYRVAFVPHDAYDLLKEDPIAFEYFYMQCCNDVIHERFASEMKYDTALRLAALQIQQHAMSNNMSGKISIKAIEKESGLDKFVAHSLMENMKSKDMRKMLAQYMKINQSLAAPGQKQLTALQAKLHYMKIVSDLKTFGSRVFMVTLLDQKSEAMVLVGPKAGVSVVTNIKSYTLTQLADFSQIENLKVTKEGENLHRVDISMKVNNKVETIGLGLLTEDAQNFVSMVVGYYHIFVDRDKRLMEKTVWKNTMDPNVPSYESQHRVLPSAWAYPEDFVSDVSESGYGYSGMDDDDRVIDLSQCPPLYEKDEAYLAKIKQELGIKADVSIESSSEPPNLSHLLSLPIKMSNGQSFEEEVTSFGRKTSNDADSQVHNSTSSQGTAVKTVTSITDNSSFADCVVIHNSSHLSQDSQLPVSLLTFKANPQSPDKSCEPNAHSEALRSSQQAISETDIHSPAATTTAGFTQFISSIHTDNPCHDINGQSLSDNTSSLSSNEASERQALLRDRQSREEESPTRFSMLSSPVMSRAKMNDGLEIESDDTDSTGTPKSSPARHKQLSRNSSIELALQSFGLHSPDTMPGADVDFQILDENVQVTASGTVEAFNSVYTSEGYMGQRLYYDPDIIDLTNFPPPETPDDDSMLDFTESDFPLPVFTSNSSLASCSKNEPDSSRPLTSPLRPSGIPNQLERSASTGSYPDFLDDDIDALIAQFTIPPPPTLTGVGSESAALNGSFNQMTKVSMSLAGEASKDNIDDYLAQLIIPPPPESSSNSPLVDDTQEVPPVPVSLSSKKLGGKSSKKNVFQHKRSSSLDINFIHNSKDEFDSRYRSVSMDGNKNAGEPSTKTPPPSGFCGEISSDSSSDIHGNSPASVSQKLHSLLQSLPNFAPDVNQTRNNSDFMRTGSLRIYRSSSIDLASVKIKPPLTTTSFGSVGRHSTSSLPIFCRSSSLRLRMRPQYQSSNAVTTADFFLNGKNPQTLRTSSSDESNKSDFNKGLDKSSSITGSESFASMKAKLKEYRDLLLSRSKSSASHKPVVNCDSRQVSVTARDSRPRSGSFSKLVSQFSRKESKSDDQGSLTLTSADTNWELKEAKPSSQLPTAGDQTTDQGVEKRVPVVLDALGLNRPTLRPISNTLNQTGENEQIDKNERINETYIFVQDKQDEVTLSKPLHAKLYQMINN